MIRLKVKPCPGCGSMEHIVHQVDIAYCKQYNLKPDGTLAKRARVPKPDWSQESFWCTNCGRELGHTLEDVTMLNQENWEIPKNEKKKTGYVIWLSNFPVSPDNDLQNPYGYYAGRDYTCGGALSPYTDWGVTDSTKIYTSEKRAKNALVELLKKPYEYIVDGEEKK